MDLEHEARLSRVESRLDTVEKRQDVLDDLVGSVRVLASREERVENDVKEIKSDVKTMMEKPAKRWDSAVEKIIMLVLTGVVVFMLAQIGL